MAIRSMTGFGRGEANSATFKVSFEGSTVNRKQFDCILSIPRELQTLESLVYNIIRKRIVRGYFKGVVKITVNKTDADLQFTAGELENITHTVSKLRAIAKHLGMKDDLGASALTTLPALMTTQIMPDDPMQVWAILEKAVNQAIDELDKMRTDEGQALCHDLLARVDHLQNLAATITQIAPEVPLASQAALEQRLTLLLGHDTPTDPVTMAREIALLADRSDISEELTRLQSHFAQFRQTLEKGGVCGRRLDFICQEFNREINTIGSKANNAEISILVIDFKTILESIREQIQNIE